MGTLEAVQTKFHVKNLVLCFSLASGYLPNLVPGRRYAWNCLPAHLA